MIYINKNSLDSPITKLVMDRNDYKIISEDLMIEDSKHNIILQSKKDEFVHACPGTKIYRCCNYHNLDIMQGCPFDCSYCILQAYLPDKSIKVSTDFDLIKEQIIRSSRDKKIRLGTGELSDSLALDHLIPLSELLIPIANKLDNLQFEFKTKSANISNLLKLNPKNILISWSLNPQAIIDNEEHYTASLNKRLESAKIVSDYGYKVAFHFDPLIFHSNFKQLYAELIEKLTDLIDENHVEYISISTFRAPTELIEAMMLRPNLPKILKSDFIKGIDGKLRYFKTIRSEMIRDVYNKLHNRWGNVFIYFCMEHSSIWEDVIGYDPQEREKFESLFPHIDTH